MQHHVFVSYSRRDQTWVDQLVEDLVRRGVKCWIDRNDIPFSVPWRGEVEDAIQACDLFLVCDSEHWQTSPACATEAAYAVRFEKVRLEVRVGQHIGAAADETQHMARHSNRLYGTATELSVRARDWDRAGRGGRALAGRRQRRRFEALRGERTPTPVESDFIAASRRRSRRKAAVSVALSFLVLVAYLSGRVAPGTEKEVNKRLARQASIYLGTRAALSVIEEDPYAGLEWAAARGGNESAAYAVIHEEALSVPLPDDAFALSEPGARFTDATISSEVRVTARDGSRWARKTDDRAQRSAQPVSDAPASAQGTLPDSGTEVRLEAGSSRIQVVRKGELWRTVVLGAAARTAKVSPDARWAVVATDTGVALVDLARGTVRAVLRGAPEPVTDLVWSQKGGRVWALAGRMVVSWQVGDGTILLDRPGDWFEEVFPAGDKGHLWVASRNGTLRLLKRDSGAVARTLHVPGMVNAVAAAPGGRTAAVVDADAGEIRTVDLASGTVHSVAVTDSCVPAKPAFAPDGRSLYVPCVSGDVVVVDTASRRTTRTIDGPWAGVRAVTWAPSGDLILGTPAGEVYSVPAKSGGPAKLLHRVQCAPDIETVAVGPGPRLLPVGEGTGLAGCTQTAHAQKDGTLKWNAFIDSRPDSVLALAAAYDPTGKAFAIGYSDGSVVLHPSDNVQPRQTLSHIAGGVRSMLTLPAAGSGGGAGDLYVATRSGLLVRIPWCPSCLTNKAMAKVAAERLRRAEDLDLYEPVADSGTPVPKVRNST
ncbi:toll/interleukin-1 receptor domain-containing protein [Streptomyces sp. Lzd4kr]|nr:toll/interleukin-1 receptor domain-containing protein [Streptomyces sp. Lzd4kr]